MQRLVNSQKAFRTLRKTSAILSHLVTGLSQAQAITRRDHTGGTDSNGWSVLTILCHQLIQQNNYREDQPIQDILAEYMRRRGHLIAHLEAVPEPQWSRTGLHPQQGPATLLDVAINVGLHDVDHIEQILNCTE